MRAWRSLVYVGLPFVAMAVVVALLSALVAGPH